MILTACGGGGDSSTSSGSLKLIEQHTGYISGAVNGYEDSIFLAQRSYNSSDNDQFLYAYRQDAVSSDLLIEEDTVYLNVSNDFINVTRMNVNSQWIATVLKYGYSGSSKSYITLIPAQRPTDGRTLELFFTSSTDVVDTVAYNDSLLIASDTELTLYNISDVSSPFLEGKYTIANNFSSLVAVPGGFYAFNNNGLTYVNCSDKDNITFTEIANEDIKKAKRAWLIGNDLYIGGPSKYANMSKIVKLDVTNPSSPVVLHIEDQIDGKAYDFAYDTASSKLYIALVSEESQYKDILEYSENVNGFNKTNTLQQYNYYNIDSFYVYNGLFYIDSYDMSVYKLQ